MCERWVKSYDIDPDHPIVGIRTGMTGYWEDLIKMAAGVDGYQGLERGQLRASRRFLADRWRCLTDKQVRGFLERLVRANMLKIEPKTGARGHSEKGPRSGQFRGQQLSLYTIVNYEKYQGGVGDRANETANDRAHGAAEKGPPYRRKKEVKEIERKEDLRSLSPEPSQVDLEEAIQAREKTDTQKAVDLWNDLAKREGLPQVKVLTDARRKSINARLKEAGGLEGFKQVIDYIGQTPVLIGKQKFSDGRTWKADFEYLVQPSAFVRNLEKAQAQQAAQPAPSKPIVLKYGEGR